MLVVVPTLVVLLFYQQVILAYKINEGGVLIMNKNDSDSTADILCSVSTGSHKMPVSVGVVNLKIREYL